MIFELYTSRGVLYAAKMIEGVAGGVQDAPGAAEVEPDDEHAANASATSAGMNRREIH
jgi:hypothetical protein